MGHKEAIMEKKNFTTTEQFDAWFNEAKQKLISRPLSWFMQRQHHDSRGHSKHHDDDRAGDKKHDKMEHKDDGEKKELFGKKPVELFDEEDQHIKHMMFSGEMGKEFFGEGILGEDSALADFTAEAF